jgi:hypothetical protein
MKRLDWKAKISQLPPQRSIIGFDLRNMQMSGSLYMTSFDEATRFEDFNEKYQDHQAGLNLFIEDPSKWAGDLLPAKATVIAYDLPAALVEALQSNVVSVPPLLSGADSLQRWDFKGFDVVDVFTQSSALWGFGLSKKSLELQLRKCSTRQNGSGLISNWDAAIRAAMSFDRKFEEHAPFVPCGVWVKE